jgi:hypothetical protein
MAKRVGEAVDANRCPQKDRCFIRSVPPARTGSSGREQIY